MEMIQVAIVLWIKVLPEYLYQYEAICRLRSRDLQETIGELKVSSKLNAIPYPKAI